MYTKVAFFSSKNTVETVILLQFKLTSFCFNVLKSSCIPVMLMLNFQHH